MIEPLVLLYRCLKTKLYDDLLLRRFIVNELKYAQCWIKDTPLAHLLFLGRAVLLEPLRASPCRGNLLCR